MVNKAVSWNERRRLAPSTYTWKGRLLTCDRWVLVGVDRQRVCQIEANGKGYTVDFYRFDPDGAGTILSFSSVGSYDLLYRRIYAGMDLACQHDVLAWVNAWKAPVAGVDGGILLSLDAWGNEVAV